MAAGISLAMNPSCLSLYRHFARKVVSELLKVTPPPLIYEEKSQPGLNLETIWYEGQTYRPDAHD